MSSPSAAEQRREVAAPKSPLPGSKRPLGDVYDAEEVFHSAMQAARAGRHKQGAALFARFIQQCSRDPRAEDAAYMRVLSLRNAGDDAGTRQAARRYLASYRSGFRRAEVQALLDVAR